MLKKKIKYEDFNGNTVTEDFFFNLTKTEVINMEFSSADSFSSYLRNIVNAENVPQMIAEFQKIILHSYGIKSEDGRHFIKIDPATGRKYADDFVQSAAYDALFTEMATDANKLADFVTNIIPKDLSQPQEQDQPTNQPRPASVVQLPPPPAT